MSERPKPGANGVRPMPPQSQDGLRDTLREAAQRSRSTFPSGAMSSPRMPRRQDGPRSRRAEGAREPINAVASVVLIALVLLAPLVMGGNRAVAWLLGSAVIVLIAAVYAFWLVRAEPGRVLRVMGFFPILLPVLLFLAYGVIQVLPVAHWLPAALVALPETGAAAPATLSIAPQATLTALYRLIGSLLFFILMIEVAGRPGRACWMGWALFLGVVAHAVWGIILLQVLGDVDIWQGQNRSAGAVVTGTFANRNAFATFLGMGAVLGLALIIERARAPKPGHSLGARLLSRDGLSDMLLWVCLAVVLIALIGTQSRLGLFATLLAMALVVLVSPVAERPARRQRRIPWEWAMIGGLVVIGLLFSTGVVERSLFATVDAETRLELYRQTLQMIAARPFAGYGLDAYGPAFELFHAPPLASHVSWDYAHSTYLTLWSEAGIIAGSLPILAGALVIWRLGRLLNQRRHEVALPVAALGAILLAGVHSLADFSLEMQANVLLLLAILALGMSRRAPPGPPQRDAQIGSETASAPCADSVAR